jgi:hypothetical protein
MGVEGSDRRAGGLDGQVIHRLRDNLERKRETITRQVLNRLQGRLNESDQESIQGAFHLLQNQLLQGPISVLIEEMSREQVGPERYTLLSAVCTLFRLPAREVNPSDGPNE